MDRIEYKEGVIWCGEEKASNQLSTLVACLSAQIGKTEKEQAYLFTLGVDTGKSLLLQRLQIEEEGPGYCHFPKDEAVLMLGTKRQAVRLNS